MKENLQKFEFREIKPEEADQVVAIEQIWEEDRGSI